MSDRDLEHLVRRRLFELQRSPDELARRSDGAIPRETIRGLARGQLSIQLTDRLARALARALEVTEYRVRRAAGMPVTDPMAGRTRPHLRVVQSEE